MSSEMRENDVSKLSAEEAVKCDDRTFADWLAFCGNGYEAHGSSYNLALIEAANRIASRTLLARTEAGADGAEPFGYFDSQGLSHAGNSTNFRWLLEQHREGKPNWGNLKLLYTHPKDASGDAEDRKALEYLMGQFDAEVHVCARCGHEDSTRDCDSAIYLRRHLGAMQQANGGGE